MKFLANENIPFPSLRFLENAGVDILSVAEHFHGISDTEVVGLAIELKRTIVTLDRDYGELVFKIGLKPAEGIAYFRLRDYNPVDVGRILFDLIKTGYDFQKKLAVIGEDYVRERGF